MTEKQQAELVEHALRGEVQCVCGGWGQQGWGDDGLTFYDGAIRHNYPCDPCYPSGLGSGLPSQREYHSAACKMTHRHDVEGRAADGMVIKAR